MAATQRTQAQDSEVLLARLEGYLATLESGHPRRAVGVDVRRAHQMAAALRTLIADTAQSCAADRARVRAAVHCFISRGIIARAGGITGAVYGQARRSLLRGRPERRVVVRLAGAHDTVVDALLRELGRHDLIVPYEVRPG